VLEVPGEEVEEQMPALLATRTRVAQGGKLVGGGGRPPPPPKTRVAQGGIVVGGLHSSPASTFPPLQQGAALQVEREKRVHQNAL
jgi:hypothetical protein